MASGSAKTCGEPFRTWRWVLTTPVTTVLLSSCQFVGPASGQDGEGQAAGPASETGELPSGNKAIHKSAARTEEALVGTEGQLDDPVTVDEVACVKVGDTAVVLGMEGVDDFGERSATVIGTRAVQLTGAFCVRAQIDGIRERIGEIELQAVAHGVAQNELSCVVAGSAGVGPGIQ